MARSFTVAQLLTRGKERADAENSNHADDTEIQGYLSASFAELYEILVDTGLAYYEATDTIATVANTATYALPAAYRSTIGLDYLVDGTTRRALIRLMTQERNAFSSNTGDPVAYRLVGTNVQIYPTPSSAKTIYHVYVPQPTDLSGVATSTSVDVVVPAGEEFIAWDIAVKLLAKEESDTSVAERNREMARQRLLESAHRRYIHDAVRRVVDDRVFYGNVRGDEGDYDR